MGDSSKKPVLDVLPPTQSMSDLAKEVESSEQSSQPSKSFREGFREFWSERFSFLNNYSRFIKREKALPHWSNSDVEEFIASDPVHGPVLKDARKAGNYALTGSVIGAVSTAGVALKYSKSLHGAALSFLAGGAFGATFGAEIANHALQLYRVDTMAAQVKFFEWWEKKSEGQS